MIRRQMATGREVEPPGKERHAPHVSASINHPGDRTRPHVARGRLRASHGRQGRSRGPSREIGRGRPSREADHPPRRGRAGRARGVRDHGDPRQDRRLCQELDGQHRCDGQEGPGPRGTLGPRAGRRAEAEAGGGRAGDRQAQAGRAAVRVAEANVVGCRGEAGRGPCRHEAGRGRPRPMAIRVPPRRGAACGAGTDRQPARRDPEQAACLGGRLRGERGPDQDGGRGPDPEPGRDSMRPVPTSSPRPRPSTSPGRRPGPSRLTSPTPGSRPPSTASSPSGTSTPAT